MGTRIKGQLGKLQICKKRSTPENAKLSMKTLVDDCISGENSIDNINNVTDNLMIVLSKGGFGLKGITFSGCDPPEHLSKNGNSVNVAGMHWFSKNDLLSLNINRLNFSKKTGGKI